MSLVKDPTRRTLLKGAGGLAALAGIGAPAIVKAQADAIRIGHLTPRTGFLGPLGEYAVMAVQMAADEVNAGGGVMGRKIELLIEDSVNPQTASAKAERFVERDKVAAIVGEISSASGLAIAQVVQRAKVLFINTGCNSDALRGSDCKRFMFHIEGANSMYVKAAGQAIDKMGLVKGKKWYSLTADYAFGHDLLKVAKRFMEVQGRPVRRGRVGADGRHRLLGLLAQNPAGAARSRGGEPRRHADHQLRQAVYRVWVAVPGRRLRLRHRACLGRRQGQFLGHLAGGLASPHRHALDEKVRRGFLQALRQAAREPGLG